jgi:hypothetical protein
MVRTFLKVYMELGSSFLFLQEQIKDIVIINVKWDNARLHVTIFSSPPPLPHLTL